MNNHFYLILVAKEYIFNHYYLNLRRITEINNFNLKNYFTGENYNEY